MLVPRGQNPAPATRASSRTVESTWGKFSTKKKVKANTGLWLPLTNRLLPFTLVFYNIVQVARAGSSCPKHTGCASSSLAPLGI